MYRYFFFFFFLFDSCFLISFFSFNVFDGELRFIILFDLLSICFLSVVIVISIVVYCYSFFYIADLFELRFCLLVLVFLFSMFLLILFPTLYGLVVGWDGLGVRSFLLVIYYNNISSLRSGVVTIYVNRFGDVLLILSFLYLYCFNEFTRAFLLNYKISFCFMLFILLSGITKRAQLPFCSWLPAAISAPTPVSSLVHSSTLVTAGIFLLMRFYYFLGYSINVFILKFLSLSTSLLAGLVACWEIDLKKVVAISTLAQLGIIIYSISIPEIGYCYYHLVSHALFKSLIFLCCGLIIALMCGRQDLRFMGAKYTLVSFITLILIYRVLRLCGFPFLRGFFSKDVLLEMAFFKGEYVFYLLIFYISCVFSIIYSFNLLSLSFFRTCKGFFIGTIYFTNYFVFLLLFFLSIIYGYFFFIFLFDSEVYVFISGWKIIGLILFIFVVLRNYLTSAKYNVIITELFFMNWFFGRRLRKLLKSADSFFNIGDINWLELVGPRGFAFILTLLSFFKIFLKKSFLFFFIILLFFCVLLFSLNKALFWRNKEF